MTEVKLTPSKKKRKNTAYLIQAVECREAISIYGCHLTSTWIPILKWESLYLEGLYIEMSPWWVYVNNLREIYLMIMALSGNTLQWHHNGHDSITNNQPHHCLLNGLFRRRSKKTSKLCVTGLCAGILPGTGEFPAQMASNAENVSIWWHHHDTVRWRDNRRISKNLRSMSIR